MLLTPSDARENTPRSKLPEHESHRGARPPARMQRFTRQEDLADLEDLGVRDEALNIDAHTSFLNSADTEGSGYIPDQAMPSMFARLYAHNHMHSEEHAWHAQHARTPAHYPPSLTGEEDNGTAPGSPHSFLSNSSIGYYSHASRPSSRTGVWVDQEASSLNLIMPSSAMFVKSRDPTTEGDRLGFVKMMVAGKNGTRQARVVQDMFKWEGIIANDYEDEFLQERSSHTSNLTALDSSEYRRPSATHVLHSSQGSLSTQSSGQHDDTSQDHRRERVTGAITERYASSMVLPAWARTGIEDGEMQQEILVKNICFVETPGYSSFINPVRAMDLVVSYLARQFHTTNRFFTTSASSDDSLGRFLANNATGAHSHVDVCLYIIEGQLTDQDITFMQRLQPWVNLVPVLIAKFSTKMDAAKARMELIRSLQDNDIQTYGIEQSEPGPKSAAPPSSTAPSLGEDMSPPPLSLDENPLQYDFTSPPFVFYPSGDPEDRSYQRHFELDVQQLDVSEGSDLRGPALASHASTPPLTSLEDILMPDLRSLRKWIYVGNLAALRHHTTLKFLRWRRHLPTIALSSLHSSQSSNFSVQHQQSDLVYPSASDVLSGSLKMTLSAAGTNSTPPASYSGPQHMSRQPLPTDLVGVLLTQERRRISIQAAKLLETHGQVFRRIVLERQEAWSLALSGMEREQRIDFLVQELKRWATDRQQKRDNHDLEGPLDFYNAGGQAMGLGLGTGISVGIEPSLREALDMSQGEASGSSRSRSKRGSDRHYSRRKHSSSQEKRSHLSRSRSDHNKNDGSGRGLDGADDPLGLGHWISQFFGAVGSGIYHVVVMIGMGSFTTCIYTSFIENRVTWIG